MPKPEDMDIFNSILNWLSKIFTWWVIIMPWERGLRVRSGKSITLLTQGIYLKLPVIDSIYVQTTRIRFIGLPVQTVTTKDGKTLSIVASAGYSITDIEKLYQTLYHPEMTIQNIVMGSLATYVATNNFADCSPAEIEDSINVTLESNDYGLGDMSIKIIGYALVKTYRLIQDGHYLNEGMTLNTKV